MKHSPIQYLFLAAALSLSVASAHAKVGPSDLDTTAKGHAGRKAMKSKPAAKVKLVDINHAGKTELQTLPGITPALADKIIAGRPYNSKFFLGTRKIVPPEVFGKIRDRISVAPQKAAHAK